ncbi:HD domain-containing phosphohydrolase [Candidatus Omnitrophota bacterium]
MGTNNKTYQEFLIKKLATSPDLKRERQLLKQLFQHPAFWIVTHTNKVLSASNYNICPAGKAKACFSRLNPIFNQVRKTGKKKTFFCPGRDFGICMPLAQGDAFYGFAVLCNLKSLPSRAAIGLLEALNIEILEKVQKDLELSKLCQTIRPRALALSTIHTVHRLISSSLDLDELLPRIARLSLQVLRAKRCLISLIDNKNSRLVPKAYVDLSKKKTNLRLSAKMKRIENEARQTGNILLKTSYLSVPLIDEESIGVITIFDKINKSPFDNFDQEILTALAEQAVGAIKNAQLYKEQENILLGTIKSLTTLLRAKSAHPYAHSQAFIDVVLAIAKELHLPEEKLRDLRFAAMLHDAGEIGIPEEILKKPAHLTDREFKIVKAHPKKSAKILSPLQRLKGAIAIIMHHHEKFDGSGYPNKLKADKIPLGARIMSVADSFEAMISRRPYRKSASIAEAVKEMKRQTGSQFDPQVIQAFLKLTKRKSFKKLFKEIYRGRP